MTVAENMSLPLHEDASSGGATPIILKHNFMIYECRKKKKSKAYTIIREGNQELKSMHKLVISGKLPVEYFNDICYSSKSNRDEEGG